MVLLRTIYLLLGLDPVEGRIAVRDPRTTDRLDMIVNLLRIKKATRKVTVDLQDLRTRLDECSRARDALAHGIWVRDDEASKWFLRFSGGSWQPPGEKEKWKRRIHLEAKEYTDKEIKDAVRAIEDALEIATQLNDEISAAFPPSHGKSP